MPKLSNEQIKQKLQEGRNYKRLYFELKDKFDDAQAEIKQLRDDNAELKQYFSGIIEAQAARITELETQVYGRKNRFRSGGGQKAPRPPRDAASYRRPKPFDNEITSEEHHPIDACHHCGGPLTDNLRVWPLTDGRIADFWFVSLFQGFPLEHESQNSSLLRVRPFKFQEDS